MPPKKAARPAQENISLGPQVRDGEVCWFMFVCDCISALALLYYLISCIRKDIELGPVGLDQENDIEIYGWETNADDL